jgi:hypothetical protein
VRAARNAANATGLRVCVRARDSADLDAAGGDVGEPVHCGFAFARSVEGLGRALCGIDVAGRLGLGLRIAALLRLAAHPSAALWTGLHGCFRVSHGGCSFKKKRTSYRIRAAVGQRNLQTPISIVSPELLNTSVCALRLSGTM